MNHTVHGLSFIKRPPKYLFTYTRETGSRYPGRRCTRSRITAGCKPEVATTQESSVAVREVRVPPIWRPLAGHFRNPRRSGRYFGVRLQNTSLPSVSFSPKMMKIAPGRI